MMGWQGRHASFIGPLRASCFLSGRRLQQKEQLRAAGKTSADVQLAPTCATKASSLLRQTSLGDHAPGIDFDAASRHRDLLIRVVLCRDSHCYGLM